MIGLLLFSVLFLCLDQCTKRLAVVHTSQRSVALGRLLKFRCVRNPLTKPGARSTRIVLPLLWLAALFCAILLYGYAGWFNSQAALAGLALAFARARNGRNRCRPRISG